MSSTDRWVALGVGVVVICVVLSLRPIIGIPRNDDFSYARTADALARTGHIAYNGWGSPLMLPQAAVGALLIKLFGFSYYILEWFGVICAATTAALLYILCRLTGISKRGSLLIVGVLVANPMFLSTAATFMTDIPSLLLLLLALIALVTSLKAIPDLPEGLTQLHLVPSRFCLSLMLGILAGTNRQLSWVAYVGALIPIFFALRRSRDRLIVGGGGAILVAAGLLASNWLAEQPMTVPTNIIPGLILLVAFTEAVFAVVYRFFFIFGLFLLPIVVSSLRLRDLKRPGFWAAIAIVAVPLLFPVSKHLGYFTGFFGAAPSGQYFTSDGVKIGYIVGEEANTQLVSLSVVYLWTALGVVALGISLYLITTWYLAARATRKSRAAAVVSASYGEVLDTTTASAFLVSTFAEILASIPWFSQLHVFDRYFLFYLPGYAIFFMLQNEIRRRVEPDSQSFGSIARGLAGVCLVSMAILSIVMTATYINFGRAQANLYWRLRTRGIPPQQIDNGLEFDADAQVELAGHVNSQEMVPKSAYDPNAMGRHIPSATPGLFPVMDGKYVLSRLPHPNLKFAVDDVPADSESYISYLPPGRRVIYVLHVAE